MSSQLFRLYAEISNDELVQARDRLDRYLGGDWPHRGSDHERSRRVCQHAPPADKSRSDNTTEAGKTSLGGLT